MITKEQLFSYSKEALENSYSPYSHFKIGAAISTTNDKIFTGCNIENVSFGLTMCGERVALFKAISEGFSKFDAIAITSNTNTAIFPCGACRQVLFEFSPNIKVYVENDERIYDLTNLLPHSFNSINAI
jgi:cytidine deaminase